MINNTSPTWLLATSYKVLHLFYDDQGAVDFAKSQLGLELI